LYNIYIVAEGDKCSDSNLVHRKIGVTHGLITVPTDGARAMWQYL